jgi:ABC-type polysaccharide/polyol phosphate transport system ATPase subunit
MKKKRDSASATRPAGPAIRIRGLGRYVGPALEMDGVNRPREAWRSLLRIAGIESNARGEGPQVTFAVEGHVLQDVSLDIERGSVVCLMPPGDESAALLRILSGVSAPTSGRAEIYGPVTSLLDVGDNLDPRLTAHENILALPVLAGVAPGETARYVTEVLDFAELHDFEHVSIRTYSTGMVLRLSVALALCGRPSIVLIDDVLAVGDIGFQQKCIDRVHELKEAGCTLVLAFGDDAIVRQLATRVITLGGGRVIGDSAPGQLDAMPVRHAAAAEWHILRTLPENDVVALRSVSVEAGDGDGGAFLDLRASFEAKVAGLRCRPVVAVAGARAVLFRSVYPEFVAVNRPGPLDFTVRVPTDVLPNGVYAVGFHMASVDGHNVYAMKASDAVSLTIRRDDPPTAGDGPNPQLHLSLPWEVERVIEGTLQ